MRGEEEEVRYFSLFLNCILLYTQYSILNTDNRGVSGDTPLEYLVVKINGQGINLYLSCSFFILLLLPFYYKIDQQNYNISTIINLLIILGINWSNLSSPAKR